MKILEIHIDKLTDFSKKNKINNVFLQPDFIKLNPAIQIHGIFAKDGQQRGVFLTETMPRLKILKAIGTPKNIPNCQLSYISTSKNPAKRNSELKSVMDAIANYLEIFPVQIVSVSFPKNWTDFQPFIWKKFKVTTQLTYQLDLTKTEDELLKNFSTERRKNITKSEKEGLIIKHIDPNEEMIEMILETFNRQDISVDEELIKNILIKTPKENKIGTIACDTDDNLLACNFCLIDSFKTTYLFGGYSSKYKNEGAGAYAMWHSIKRTKEKGIEVFDFEGSMIPQVEKYFRGFGGDLVPFYRVNKSSYLVELLLKAKERTLF